MVIMPVCLIGHRSSILLRVAKFMSPSSTYGIRIPDFQSGESGSIPDGDAIFRMLTANFYNFFGKSKERILLFLLAFV
jgi:hypothetical protein